MRDQLIPLCEHLFQPGTMRADIGGLFACCRADLSADPVTLIFDFGNGPSVRNATDGELSAILSWLQDLPLLRPLMTRREVMGLFTEPEKSAIRTAAPGLIELLLAAEEPISSDILIPYFSQLQAGGILTAERFTEITGRAV